MILMMQNINIAATSSTPQVKFETNGILFLKGRSIILDVDSFYQPLCEWLKQLQTTSVRFTLEFDYFNSSSSKKILELLKIIDACNNIKDFDVYWHFETDDEDILEIGQIFEERLRKARFFYKEYAEAS
jgi:hypothetical protein